jgi:hypothetical protein
VMPALAREAADRMGALLLPGEGWWANCKHNCYQNSPCRAEHPNEPLSFRVLAPLDRGPA